MLVEGNIIYFDPFYFKNGNSAKPKYGIVLKLFGNNSNLILSLTTRKDSIPAGYETAGCINIDDYNFNCYHFPKDVIVTQNQKGFPMNTFIYGYALDQYETSYIKDTYQFEDVDYTIFGQLNRDVYDDIITCLRESSAIKRKYKKILAE